VERDRVAEGYIGVHRALLLSWSSSCLRPSVHFGVQIYVIVRDVNHVATARKCIRKKQRVNQSNLLWPVALLICISVAFTVKKTDLSSCRNCCIVRI
jgi:hypothetical protein